jgi:ADP-ribose pyrophosphatase YjhB (NUDIX family)
MSLRAWTSCPVCREPLTHGDLHVACAACGFVQYENPAATTLAMVLDGRELLLVRRAQEPRAGLWDTIGGFVDPGETAEEGVAREVREEIACELDAVVPVGTFASVYGETGRSTLGIAFACRLAAGARPRLSAENDAAQWFGLDALPELAFADGDAAVAALLEDWDALVARLG